MTNVAQKEIFQTEFLSFWLRGAYPSPVIQNLENLKAFCSCLVSFGNLFMLWSDIWMAKLAKNLYRRTYFLQRCYASAKRNIFRYHCYGFVI